eukprot:TRINITY_DN85859_c0_g1_i1.p1 TRINITY_DN85859_c0_g1~~TRINITY_DN85859_c0_g1_i1.p1  ORF type:complete len:168 (+),score=24.04 TRINITY_DN85859_c0_g1_i1:230-733(+)
MTSVLEAGPTCAKSRLRTLVYRIRDCWSCQTRFSKVVQTCPPSDVDGAVSGDESPEVPDMSQRPPFVVNVIAVPAEDFFPRRALPLLLPPTSSSSSGSYHSTDEELSAEEEAGRNSRAQAQEIMKQLSVRAKHTIQQTAIQRDFSMVSTTSTASTASKASKPFLLQL